MDAMTYIYRTNTSRAAFFIAFIVYGILLTVNACNHIEKDAEVKIEDYKTTIRILRFASLVGVFYACLAITIIAVAA